MTETVETTATGAILYDQAIINQIAEDAFGAEGWAHAERVPDRFGSGGRGNTMFVGNVPEQLVLRHYCRGGLVGKFVHDRYIWLGEAATRSFAEWRMLEKMVKRNLRVPRPAAARYVRHGGFYTADIITVTIPNVRPLSSVIADTAHDRDYWGAVGAAIQAFHAAGVYHADMNAYNVQIDDRDQVWLLDFDKGRFRDPGPWQQQTLERLHRSLKKLKAHNPALYFNATDWNALLGGYFAALRSA